MSLSIVLYLTSYPSMGLALWVPFAILRKKHTSNTKEEVLWQRQKWIRIFALAAVCAPKPALRYSKRMKTTWHRLGPMLTSTPVASRMQLMNARLVQSPSELLSAEDVGLSLFSALSFHNCCLMRISLSRSCTIAHKRMALLNYSEHASIIW